MASNKQPNPIERLSAKFGVSPGTVPGFIRNRAWANTQKAVKEDALAPEQLRLLDALVASFCVMEQDTNARLGVYAALAQQVRHLSGEASAVWADGAEAAVPQFIDLWRTPGFDPTSSEEDAELYVAASGYYDRFGATLSIEDLSEEEKAAVLENYAVLISAGLEAVGAPFAFLDDEVAAAILQETDCNPFGGKLGEDEREQAVAVFKLAAAWPVESEGERRELGQLAMERPEDADRAVEIIRGHSPATVEELGSLLDTVPAGR